MKSISYAILLFLAPVFLTLTLAACSPPADKSASMPGKPAASEAAGQEECVLKPAREDVACTMQYDPVCGCDGKNYSNSCVASSAGVPRSTPGACEEESLK